MKLFWIPLLFLPMLSLGQPVGIALTQLSQPVMEELKNYGEEFRNYANEGLELLSRNPALKSSHDTLRNVLATPVTVDANQFTGDFSEKHVILNHNHPLDGDVTIVLNPTRWDPLEPKVKRRYALLTYVNIIGILSTERDLIISELDAGKESSPAPSPPH